MLKVVTGIYLRVSTEEQAREGYSIRAHEEKLRGYANIMGWPVYSVYIDEGISGKDIDGRPEMKRLIADVVSGKVKNVLIYKIDRLTRSTKNLIELIELFNQNNCAFNSLTESIDTNTATGRMFLKIVGIFAEFERENLAERVRLGLERKAREGYSTCAFIPSYGYDRTNGERVQKIESNESEVVRRIFNMYLHDDYSFYQIVRTLTAENIPTKRDGNWHISTIKQILTNPNYIGKVRYSCMDSERYFEADGQHEPIVNESIYYQTQDKLQKLKRITPTKRPTDGVYFCGVMYCPACGGKYTSKWNYKKCKDSGGNIPINPSYRCSNSMQIKGTCTARKSMSHAKIERAFEQYIKCIDDFTEETNPDTPTETTSVNHSREIEKITVEIKQITRKIEEIMELFVSGSIDFSTYQGMVKISSQRRNDLESRLNLLENDEVTRESLYSKSEIVANFRENWQTLDNEQRLQFVQKFIKKMVVRSHAPNGEIYGQIVIDEIVFNEF